jgi:hypothetical protein
MALALALTLALTLTFTFAFVVLLYDSVQKSGPRYIRHVDINLIC